MKKDTLLISHQIDLDGLGSLILAKYYNLDIDQFYLVAYGKDFTEEGEPTFPTGYKNIIVTDFSVEEKLYQYIVKNTESYKIFDHHESSKQWEDDENCFIDIEKCGTKLFYEYITKGKRVPVKVKQMVDLIDVYDLWKLDSPLRADAENLNRVLWQSISYNRKGWHQYESFIDRQVFKLKDSSNDFYFDDYEKILIQQAIEKEDIQLKLGESRMQKRIDKKGNVFAVYDGKSKISLVCSKLLDKYPELKYIINVNTFAKFKEEINGNLSARSKEGFNVTDFKEINGHLQAGGGNEGIEFATDFLSGKINELTYEDE